jgi:hypothetical protein
MADNVIPFDRRERLEASLRPAKLSAAQAAVAALTKSLAILPSIQDPPAFKQIMAEHLAPYPHDVLLTAVKQAIADFKDMPSIKEMLEICEALMKPRRAELRALEQAEDERRAHEQAEREWQRQAAERAAADRRWCVDLQARFAAIAGRDAPDLDDVERATRLKPTLLRAGWRLRWGEVIDETPRAAVTLCKRLAEIDRGNSPDQDARIAGALTDAGLEAAGRRPLAAGSAETEARPVGEILGDVLTHGGSGPEDELVPQNEEMAN